MKICSGDITRYMVISSCEFEVGYWNIDGLVSHGFTQLFSIDGACPYEPEEKVKSLWIDGANCFAHSTLFVTERVVSI